MPVPAPMTLRRQAKPFDHPDWIFELKYDGFRALCILEDGAAQFVSRTGNVFRHFAELAAALPKAIMVRSAVIDGEVVTLDDQGKPVFNDMLRRKGRPVFVAFDVLSIGGVDLRELPLIERKARLRTIVAKRSNSVLYLDHVDGAGVALFEWACSLDLEGIVAKLKAAPYRPAARSTWVKIKNAAYSQAVGRYEKFEGFRGAVRPKRTRKTT